MNFDFSDDQKFLRDEARKFLEAQCTMAQVREVLDDDSKSHNDGVWKKIVDMGWLGAAIPEEYGGLGLGMLELCVIAEELGRTLAPVPFGSSAYFFAEGLFGYAGWIMIFGATFDMFDGKVARMTGKVSRSGAYYDSVMDRFGEGVVMIGLVSYFRYSWMLYFVVAGLIGSMLVSYTRARGEGVGIVCKKGPMQRPERIVYLGVASVFQPIANYFLRETSLAYEPILVIAAIILIGVMTNITAIYRMVYIMNGLDTEDKKDGIDSIPQVLMKWSTPEGRAEWMEKVRQRHHLK